MCPPQIAQEKEDNRTRGAAKVGQGRAVSLVLRLLFIFKRGGDSWNNRTARYHHHHHHHRCYYYYYTAII